MISTHILDTSSGNPAAGVNVLLDKRIEGEWKSIDQQKTNTDGRIVFNCPNEAGDYRLLFEIADYFKQEKKDFFFLKSPVVFKISDVNRKYHVPLLLNPFGYSTYRGS